jgi:hypothetical protein
MKRRRRQPSTPRAYRASFWARFIAALVLTVVTSTSTLAWAVPCCSHGDCAGERDEGAAAPADEAAEAGDDDDDDHEPCSCPPDCGPCCGVMPPPALVPAVAQTLSLLLSWIDLLPPPPDRGARPGIPKEVLHVPKQAARSSA